MGQSQRRREYFFDFTLFESAYFEQSMSKRSDFECLFNSKESVLCLVHAKSDFYFYSQSGDEMDIFCAVCFVVNEHCNDDFVRIFVSKKSVDQSEEMSKMFESAKNKKKKKKIFKNPPLKKKKKKKKKK